jgi:hypothetical protein
MEVVKMYNPNQRKVMVLYGKQADKIYEQSQKPIRNTAEAARKARERLRKNGMHI